jgi:pimeloyl-ACP methyl ester carboxylesterase
MSLSADRHIKLRDGRKLTYAEYGDFHGRTIFLFHGIPGSRMIQHPDPSIAIESNARLIVPDRPGMGLSDFKIGRKLLDWPADVEELANKLGIDEFSVVGYSGGGPYAAACGFAIPNRLLNVGLISAVGPIDAPDALKDMLPSNRMGYSVGRWMPWFLWRQVFKMYYQDVSQHPEKLAVMMDGEPESDRILFATSGIREILIKNFSEAFRQGTKGTALDGWLLSRPWGFTLEEISVPVYLWQGKADVVVTPAMGQYMATMIPKCHAKFYSDEGHLAFIAHWQDILQTLINEQ